MRLSHRLLFMSSQDYTWHIIHARVIPPVFERVIDPLPLSTSMLQHHWPALLPIIQALFDIDPISQPHSLLLRRHDIILMKRLLQHILALPDALIVDGPQLLQVLLGRGIGNLLVRLQHDHEQARIVDLHGLVGGDVDAAQGEEVLRAEERVGEGLVGLVDEGRGGFGAGLEGSLRVHVWVVAGLELEEFAAEGAGVDGEVARGRGPEGEGFGEDFVVGWWWWL